MYAIRSYYEMTSWRLAPGAVVSAVVVAAFSSDVTVPVEVSVGVVSCCLAFV